jgi:hypothetical protein
MFFSRTTPWPFKMFHILGLILVSTRRAAYTPPHTTSAFGAISFCFLQTMLFIPSLVFSVHDRADTTRFMCQSAMMSAHLLVLDTLASSGQVRRITAVFLSHFISAHILCLQSEAMRKNHRLCNLSRVYQPILMLLSLFIPYFFAVHALATPEVWCLVLSIFAGEIAGVGTAGLQAVIEYTGQLYEDTIGLSFFFE